MPNSRDWQKTTTRVCVYFQGNPNCICASKKNVPTENIPKVPPSVHAERPSQKDLWPLGCQQRPHEDETSKALEVSQNLDKKLSPLLSLSKLLFLLALLGVPLRERLKWRALARCHCVSHIAAQRCYRAQFFLTSYATRRTRVKTYFIIILAILYAQEEHVHRSWSYLIKSYLEVCKKCQESSTGKAMPLPTWTQQNAPWSPPEPEYDGSVTNVTHPTAQRNTSTHSFLTDQTEDLFRCDPQGRKWTWAV